MEKRTRRRFTAEEKSRSLIRHLQDGVAVSQLCDELQIHLNQYFEWQRLGLAGLPQVFDHDGRKAGGRLAHEVDELKEQLRRKDSVIAELLSEHMTLKKSLGVK